MGRRSRSSDSSRAERPESGPVGPSDSDGGGPADPDGGGPPNATRNGSDAPSDAGGSRDADRPGDAGVRVEVVVREPTPAPVAAALPPGAVAEDVDRVRVDDAVVSQFRAHRAVDAELVFDGGDEFVYRCRSPAADDFPSDAVESLGYPVSSVTVRTAPARVRLGLSLPAADPLGDVIDVLEATGGSVRLERLTSSGGADTRSDPVVVDRGRLTERQREVVRTAQRLGYFEHPRGASATEVADAIGIARATFSEHLAAAQRRVFEDLVGG
ncbi:DNA binding protein [Halorubrum californiense DSM 19288]|uniref:DNA binding protein n=1 Tax=Halorubrum californiense DSM 19288 TaxID=1227465 RepID=M0EJP4_9EURY|nr:MULTISPECIES: helix-turn-helix domain-containing protein [Halorubrum]ELZ47970.1 DNA binding protein [Halorubrum californiense DSM 19288]TKX65428.1 helix-turn-helix domain-containing protein [Halorubrum sp. GN11GM_10-3_MGM]